MSNDRLTQVEELFHRALQVPDGARREFIDAIASDDAELGAEVLALLGAHGKSHAILDAPRVSELPPGMRLGPYALERVLGAGGMGTVYLARRADRQFEKQVAIKLVNQGFGAEIKGGRFQLERQILARLEHSNIARLLDAGVNDFGQPYLVMEWVDGVPLNVWLAREQPTVDRRLDLWLAIAAAVSYAHRNLIVHRDLKPSNVLVTADGIPKLVDFGIAKLLGDATSANATLTQRFTPLYASPEQVRGQSVTTSTDIYSLGLLLYELIVGAHPFHELRESPHEHVDAVLHREVQVPDSVPTDLAAILSMALRKESERRYVTVDQFADDVRRFQKGLPVVAQPETATYRVRKFVARHRVAVGVSATVAVTLMTLTAVAIWQARIANEQRARADEQRARAQQVTSMISGVLGVTPEGPEWALRATGAALRVVDLIDLTAARVDREPNLEPEAEATLRSAFAMAYWQTGEVAKAERHSQRALDLFNRFSLPSDPARLGAELVDAVVLIQAGRFREAEQRLVAISHRWPNAPAVSRLMIDDQLGQALFRLGRLDEAERIWITAIRAVEDSLGRMYPALSVTYSNLSLVYLERGQFDRAATELEHAVAIGRSDRFGAQGLGWALTNLANTYRFLGRFEQSLIAATESLQHMRATLGETHHSLIHPIAFIAHAKALGREPDAEEIIRKGVALQQQLAPDHFERAVGLTFLGFVLMHKGQLVEARQSLERALEIRRLYFKAPNWRIAETAGFLGELYARQGDLARGRALLRESLETFTTLYGSSNPRTIEALQRLNRWKSGERQ